MGKVKRPDKAMSRIYAGEKAKQGQIPYQVFLTVYMFSTPGKQNGCSGSLIRLNWVLTAGHCLVNNENRTIPAQRYDVVQVEGDFGGALLSNATQGFAIPTTLDNPIFSEVTYVATFKHRSSSSGQFNPI